MYSFRALHGEKFHCAGVTHVALALQDMQISDSVVPTSLAQRASVVVQLMRIRSDSDVDLGVPRCSGVVSRWINVCHPSFGGICNMGNSGELSSASGAHR